MSAWRLLQELVGWLNVLACLAGVVICALRLGRSRWIGLLMGGFAIETLVAAFFRVITYLLGLSGGLEHLGAAFAIVSLVGLMGRLAIVGGLAGLLAEVWGGAASPPPA